MINKINRLFFGMIYLIFICIITNISYLYFNIGIAILNIVCVRELYNIFKISNRNMQSMIFFIFIFFIAIFPILLNFIYKYGIIYNKIIISLVILSILYNIYFVFYVSKFYNSNILNVIFNIIFICTYILLPFLLTLILHLESYFYSYDLFILFILIMISDSFSYIIGISIGNKKLAPNISPLKTWEGVFGGILCTIFFGLLFILYFKHIYSFNWIYIVFFTSVLSPIGDLLESKLKRNLKLKDTSTLIPGHGGILDRLDSFLFVIPFIYLILFKLNIHL